MKKANREKKDLKLQLHRETLLALDRTELTAVAGGATGECHKATYSCNGSCGC